MWYRNICYEEQFGKQKKLAQRYSIAPHSKHLIGQLKKLAQSIATTTTHTQSKEQY